MLCRDWCRSRRRCRCRTDAPRRTCAGTTRAGFRFTSPPRWRRCSRSEGRSMRMRGSVVLALLLWIGVAHAQGGGSLPAAETLVKVEVAPVSVAAGGSATASVKLTILAGWHVNSNPPARKYNIPTKVTLTGASGLTPGAVHYPAGKKEKFAFEDEPLLVYDGTVEVTVPIAAAAGATSAMLAGTVEYQSCNNEVCLAPVSVPFSVKVDVTAASASSGTAPPQATSGS